MANLVHKDVDMSEFEKLADSLEFENKQYVKMIEKENQCILSLQNQIKENKEKIQRVDSDISRMDEDTRRLHKQFVQSKETLKNLKDTYNVMMDHEMALSKQLESLKIKSEEERQYYKEQVTNYSKIKDDHMRKYESFPLAIELHKQKEKLSEKQKESEEMEAVIMDLQEKIRDKEAVLDTKVLSRMIIKIAGLKVSTLETEKEIDKCLVEKAMLLEQLKEIQQIQQPSELVEACNQEATPASIAQDDTYMDCEEVTNDDNNAVVNHLGRPAMTYCPRTNDDCTNVEAKECSDGDNTEQNDIFFTPMEGNLQNEILQDNRKAEQSNIQVTKSGSNISLSSDDGSSTVVRSQALSLPKTTSSLTGTVGRDQTAAKVSTLIRENLTLCTPGNMNRVHTLPRTEPIQKAVHKIPTFKPLQRYRMPLKEISKDVQASAISVPKLTITSPKVTIPTFNRNKLSVPKLNVPNFSSYRERLTDSTLPLKKPGSSSPLQTDDKRHPPQELSAATTTSTAFNLPKVTEISRLSRGQAASDTQSCGQPNIKLKNPSFAVTGLRSSLHSSLLKPNDKSNVRPTPLAFQQSMLKHKNYEISVRETKSLEQRQLHPDKQIHKVPQSSGFSLKIPATDNKIDSPLFKQSATVGHPSKSALMTSAPKPFMGGNSELKPSKPLAPPPPPPPPPQLPSTSTITSLVEQNNQKTLSKPSPSFTMGSIFKPNREDDSQSPTAFSLFHPRSGGGDGSDKGSQERSFLSFGDFTSDANGGASGADEEEDGPTSLFDLFKSPGTQGSGKSQAEADKLNFNFSRGGTSGRNDDKDEGQRGSFFNLDNDVCDSSGGGGGFLNSFGGDDDDDDDSGKNKSFFNLF